MKSDAPKSLTIALPDGEVRSKMEAVGRSGENNVAVGRAFELNNIADIELILSVVVKVDDVVHLNDGEILNCADDIHRIEFLMTDNNIIRGLRYYLFLVVVVIVIVIDGRTSKSQRFTTCHL